MKSRWNNNTEKSRRFQATKGDNLRYLKIMLLNQKKREKEQKMKVARSVKSDGTPK